MNINPNTDNNIKKTYNYKKINMHKYHKQEVK